MRKYDLSVNNNKYEVIVKRVTETEALVEVNGQEHTVSINQIESLVLPESIPKVTPGPEPGRNPGYPLAIPAGSENRACSENNRK